MEYSRAKAIGGQGFVYGYPIVVPELPYPAEPPEEGQEVPEPVMIGLMFPTDISAYEDKTNWTDAAIRINPSTIQRHIGGIGANVVDVFEGDIIIANVYPFENWNAVLAWNNKNSTFMLKFSKKKNYAGRDIFADMVEPIKYLTTAKVDVIGNTIDNANLL